MLATGTIVDEIVDLKKDRRAVILAHHYQESEIQELADVIGYSMALANELGIDVSDAIRNKMVKNRIKYPAEEFRGRYRRDG